ncbi:colanic acid biosynthesis glycosyltransferase WcaL [Salipiger pallidus]|uniref:Colanic acid biosynthesis glycosyltransferase WcaL n=1 Tax=Salipiger pallidus TaxID=1775170 RepID=A0A8J3EH74_9RHOB|nr:glycosyltransferase [Salipiger pallidus]GGG78336.1 colanic acid biosynthesis glycosyltransferase WcaL [Salipiger pallidus]
MSLPKLAYLTGEYPRASDTFIQREVAALRALGHEVVTCSIRTTGAEHLVGPEQREEHGRTFKVLSAAKSPLRLARATLRFALGSPVRFARSLCLAWKTAPRGVRGRAYNLIYFLEAAVLADRLKAEGVAHLHNHIAKASCTVAMLASELSGIPYSFTIHGPDIFFEPYHWRIDEKTARASFVACISDYCRSQLMVFADPAHWDKLHIIHCGIDPDRYAPSAHTGQTLLFVGRLAGVKGVPILLDAVAALKDRHPHLRLALIGDGPERAALEARAKPLGETVVFLGYQSQDAVAEALSQSDVFVLPSFAEGVPVVLMEAMAAGVPVVATQIAGIPELVSHWDSGILVRPGDVEALTEAIDQMLASADQRRVMGAVGRATVESEFNIRTEAARLSQLFCNYADKQAPATREVPE